jgi:hypothetical protein
VNRLSDEENRQVYMTAASNLTKDITQSHRSAKDWVPHEKGLKNDDVSRLSVICLKSVDTSIYV